MLDLHEKEELNMKELESDLPRSCFAANRVLVPLILVAGICVAAIPGFVTAQTEKPDPAAADSQLPQGKRTTLGRYVTAKEAYEMW
jgi:hypothetical protein